MTICIWRYQIINNTEYKFLKRNSRIYFKNLAQLISSLASYWCSYYIATEESIKIFFKIELMNINKTQVLYCVNLRPCIYVELVFLLHIEVQFTKRHVNLEIIPASPVHQAM